MSAVVRHRPKITRTAGEVGTVYRFTCPCGAAGEDQPARRLAQADRNAHVLSLPRVPAAQQCQDPRAHDRSPWESCGLCEKQLPLFDLEGVA
ncbi:hypothetical protein [Streptosporangium saharense]|uniref:Uncharacterized protein n=1 Tax=Streptosporangium saharense TaxID=1706840 RepID=A0A7W7QWA6_9ACTN|nr:hypothetical protein [Streptosporangium saharense]MBB4920977.1 hypothetical protein [Streptosporangium saharense]